MKLVISISIFILIFILIFYLRMMPAINNRVEFILDCAFNYRMTEDLLRNGDVPAIDRLSTYPDGKNIKAFLPTGMYHACAFFHNVLNRLGRVPLSRSILLFCAFCGSLIFLPAYFISYEIYRDKLTAYLTAFLSGTIPAYLNRTLCYWYRYEIAAAAILFTSLLFFMKAFSASDAKKAFTHSIISAAFLTLALYIWRLAILFLIVYSVYFLYLRLKESKFHKSWSIIIFTILGVYLTLALFIPGFGSKNPSSDYWAFPKAAVQIVLHNIGIKQDFSEFTRLVYYNQELGGVNFVAMFGWLFLSFSGIFALIYIFVYFTEKDRGRSKEILFIFLIFFIAVTFIFSRNKIILGPLVALTAGESIKLIYKNKRGMVKLILSSLVAIAVIKTGCDAYKLAATRRVNTKIDPYLKQSLSNINALTPENAVILCYWADGYPIQTYCNRSTITDGLFESPEIVRRIIMESVIFYSYNEDELWDYCKRRGATHLLIPTNRKRAYAGYAGVEYDKYYQVNRPTALGRLTTLFKLMHAPGDLKRFRSLYKNKEFALYALIGG